MKRKATSQLRLQPAGGKAAAVPVGRKVQLQIERMAHDGRGIAYLEGRTWFVSGALPGEQVQAQVLGGRQKLVEARMLAVLTPSAQRREPACPHTERCGGCNLQHWPEAQQLAFKQQSLADQLKRVAQLEPEHWAAPLAGEPLAYRRRARVAVRWNAQRQQLDVGFRAEASQEVVALNDCAVLVQPLQKILHALPATLNALEAPQSVGHVELFYGDASAVLVRHTKPLSESDQQALQRWADSHAAQLWLQGKGEPEASVAGQVLSYSLPSWQVQLGYRPGDFVQVNAALNERMVAQALDWLGDVQGLRVLDLFSGLGNFSLPLARCGAEVTAVEGVAGMVARAQQNAEANGLNVRCVQADLFAPLAGNWLADGCDIVLLDPPRDGAQQVAKQIKELGAARVLYVSCNPATLARDAALLAEQGYRLVKAGLLDMFPQTAHAEAMALFAQY
ncbi:23S rRNA (uracil1939-C5)-methyltransferase [Atopomonas hussainii]|uniref:23S rRNA (uracil(1939)-C(5))-methyltransferase RlmD n=1 Tax=Atopomonas hussainii TaxID=1429083 RepID=A0A1H7PU64_9GAMM|nr:23S rRNA (uracil(1939)-C(5))-methyltransferase RlmD [Atopomonas hussainii]SEL39116.1 23S rRNA (uracil1939-C5)-methyltransferase [Atopomonas hussainii]